MTPAQVAHIMALVDAAIAGARVGDALRHRAAVEAALRDAPQAEPDEHLFNLLFAVEQAANNGALHWEAEEAFRAYEASKAAVMHKPSGFTFDQVIACANPDDLVPLTTPSAPTAVEPDERCDFELWMNTQPESASGKWWCRQLDDGGYSCHESDVMWRAWQAARASKGTPL